MGNQKDNTLQWPKDKGQTMIYKTLHRKLKIKQHEPHYICNTGADPGGRHTRHAPPLKLEKI